MGLFGRKKMKFVPNFTLSEYDNWLNYLDSGGTSQEWDKLKKVNKWSFAESETKKYERYQKEVDLIASKYYSRMSMIQTSWSTLYNLGDYTGALALKFEKECLVNIDDYKKMHAIDVRYNQKTATNIPAFKRLAMLYEKQGRYEEAVGICKQACALGMDERSRMLRMIKKVGRSLTDEEQELVRQ